MITMQQALMANEFWHSTHLNADGAPARCRRNGKTQTWAHWPALFRIPVKIGWRTHFYIQNFDDRDVHGVPRGKDQSRNDTLWCVPELWEAEHVLFEGVKP